MKNTAITNINTVSNHTNNTITTKGVKTMKNTNTKKRSFKTRIIAGILSAVTIFSVGAMSMTSASAATPPAVVGTVLKYVTSTSFGYAKTSTKKIAGPELAKMGLSPILNMVLGIEEEGTSNDDIMDKIDKSTAEIKAEIGKVMDEVKELSTQTANYHTKQMNQLKAINSNIDTKDFRVQADTVAADFAHALKRIDENKVNITCDGSDKINNTTYKAYKEILADPKCNVSSMQANFDEMLRYLRGQRTSNNNENGYRQLTNYLMDRVVAADLGEHSYTKTPDYYGAVDNINAEIRVMEQQVLMDYAIINVLNSMQYRVREYEIDNGIITVNEDEDPFAKFENTATDLHDSLTEMDTLFDTVLKENASIPDKYVTTDLYVYEDNGTVKKGCTSFMDAWSQGIDSGKNFDIKVLKNTEYLTADAKKGFKFDNNIKGLNAKGGFEIPAGRTININMYTYNNGFDGSAKKDMDMFTIQSGASFKLEDAEIRGTDRKFVIPDNAKNTNLKLRYIKFYGNRNNYNYDSDPCIYISKKAANTNIDLEFIDFNCEQACQIQNDSKTTKISEWFVDRYWVQQEHDAEYWGT